MLAPDSSAVSASTRLCGVFGHPIRHSASPAMQNAGMLAMGLDWRYLAFEVPPEQLDLAINGAKAMRWIGLNLTVPHKLLAVPLVDQLDESARTWGAVNTIRFEVEVRAGDWTPLARLSDSALSGARIRAQGFNTDADALVRSVGEDLGMELAGASILILGIGGAGRTAALRLAAAGIARLHLVNRTVAKAAEVANEIRRRFPGVEVQLGYPRGEIDLMLNATSLGLDPADSLPIDLNCFRPEQARGAYDMIYRPAETRWLRWAREGGCRVANGLGMLLYQGAAALELWSGREAPLAPMRRALEANVYGRTADV